MKTDLTTHADTAYLGFKAIDTGEYREKIRFVDQNRVVLEDLPVQEYAEVMDAFAEALFETGRYERHIPVATTLTEFAIEYNIREVNGRDVFFETLFQKAASLYNLHRLSEAIYILQELIRINPLHESTRLFLINCHVEQQKCVLRIIRAASIVLIMISAVAIAVELIIRPFMAGMALVMETIRNAAFVAGVTVLVAGEGWVRYRAVSRVYDYSRKHRRAG